MHVANMALKNVNSKYKAIYYFGRIKSLRRLVSVGETPTDRRREIKKVREDRTLAKKLNFVNL